MTEKKEERSSNTSMGRSCSPLYPAGGHICWFSGPQIINLSADDGWETWEWRPTQAHTHTHLHTQTCTCTYTHLIILAHNQAYVYTYMRTHTHTHTLCCITNDGTFNCCACLFTPGCNGWSFSAWQPIRGRQEECEQPCRTGHLIWHSSLYTTRKHKRLPFCAWF